MKNTISIAFTLTQADYFLRMSDEFETMPTIEELSAMLAHDLFTRHERAIKYKLTKKMAFKFSQPFTLSVYIDGTTLHSGDFLSFDTSEGSIEATFTLSRADHTKAKLGYFISEWLRESLEGKRKFSSVDSVLDAHTNTKVVA
jgi:hypothetical protein